MAADQSTKRYAVVTGANRGIGLATCKQLASKGIFVVLTARDERKGLEAVEKLKAIGLLDHVLFHQLDVTDPASIASLAHFIETNFGKLDILINNAGCTETIVDMDALTAVGIKGSELVSKSRDVHFSKERGIDWSKITIRNYELAERTVKTNYYGAKEMTIALFPLLSLSDSRTIVNVSSTGGSLESLPNRWVKEVLSDVENLTIEKIDDILSELLKDFKETKGALGTKGWPDIAPAYCISKAALNGFTRILAATFPSFCINALCPGPVLTDMNQFHGHLTPDEGAQHVVRLALLPNGSPSGLFFDKSEERSF